MARVSIIIPVYNAEKTLQRCVESILDQEYTDFELILVDDGSKDSSGKICDEYVTKDKRVRVIHKENSGVSDARNCGIEAAEGEYLQFVDADDWITPDATKLMVREASERECELVIADFYRVVGKRVSHKGSIKEERVMTRVELAEHMLDNPADFYYGVLWNKLFRKDIIMKHNIRMDADISWCEDFLFNLEYILYVNKVFALQVPVYYYLKTEGSLVSQSMNIGHVVRTKRQVFECYNDFYKDVYDEKDYAKKRFSIYRFLIDMAGDGVVMPGFLPNSKKLGEERIPVVENAVRERGFLTDDYRNSKLLEHYYQAIGIRYDLSLNDIKLLAHVSRVNVLKNRKELADYTGISISSVNRILKKLERKRMIKIIKYKEYFKINIMEAGVPAFRELQNAFSDYDNVRFQGFTEEEIKNYLRFQERIEENMNRVLKGINTNIKADS